MLSSWLNKILSSSTLLPHKILSTNLYQPSAINSIPSRSILIPLGSPPILISIIPILFLSAAISHCIYSSAGCHWPFFSYHILRNGTRLASSIHPNPKSQVHLCRWQGRSRQNNLLLGNRHPNRKSLQQTSPTCQYRSCSFPIRCLSMPIQQ